MRARTRRSAKGDREGHQASERERVIREQHNDREPRRKAVRHRLDCEESLQIKMQARKDRRMVGSVQRHATDGLISFKASFRSSRGS